MDRRGPGRAAADDGHRRGAACCAAGHHLRRRPAGHRCRTGTYADDALPDSPASQQAYTSGLSNAGNTCYFNAALQCLFAVPELRSALVALATRKQVRAAICVTQ